MKHQYTTMQGLSCLLILIVIVGIVDMRRPAAAEQSHSAPSAEHSLFLPLLDHGAGTPTGDATSEELINQAIARGEIDADTGLVYKVFAAFADPRLPAAYRGGAPEAGMHSAAGWELRERYQSLSADQQALMAPFLIPPMHHGSWWQQRYAPAAAAGANLAENPVQDSSILDTEWNSILTNNGKVRIWWMKQYPTDAQNAQIIADEIRLVIWPELAKLMGREPLSDNGSVKTGRGGDNAFDIILYDGSSSVETYDWCSSNSPGYMLYNRNIVDWQEELAHELMHAFQFAFDTKTGCVTTTYRWLSESTAQWVPDLIYPQSTYEHRAAKFFLDEPHLALDTVQDNGRHYGAYLAWLYIDKVLKQPSMIGQLWRNTELYGPVEVVDRTFPGGFEQLWPQVLLHNWNQGIYNQYEQHDGMKHRPALADKQIIDLSLGSNPHREHLIPVEIERLAGTYHHYTFPLTDTNTRLITFYNGVTFDLSRERVNYAERSFDAYVWAQVPPTEWQGASVQALFKVNGQWIYEDWSGKPYRSFCRDTSNERIEELVLIVGNSRWENLAFDVEELNDPSAITVSNIGCWRYQGSASANGSTEHLDRTTEAKNVVFEAIPPVVMNVLSSDPSRMRYFLSHLEFRPLSGDLSMRGSLRSDCGGEPPRIVVGTLSGNGPVRSFAEGNTFTNLRISAFTLGGSHHRHYQGSGFSMDLGTLSQSCNGPTPVELGLWWETTRLQGRAVPNSGVLADTYSPEPGMSSTWWFSPQQQ